MEFKQDCNYFFPDRPCKIHKNNSNINCNNCNNFVPEGKKVLVIKLAALGDVVRTTSILKPLYKKYNKPSIFWVTYKDALPILDNNPYVKEKISYDLAWQLAIEKFDVLINLDLDNDALRLTKIVSAEKKVGFYLDDNNKIFFSNHAAKKWFELSHDDNSKKNNTLTYQKYMMQICELKVAKPKDYPIILNLTEEEKKFAENFAFKNNIRKTDFVIGINTGGGDKWPKKELPVENTVELIKLLVKTDKLKNKKLKILLLGGKKEKVRNERIIKILKSQSINIIDSGTTNTLREFFSLVNLCNLLVVTDSLALHIALGLKKKVVSLFGPTSANEIELYGLGKKIVSPMECVCCYNRDCQKEPFCMQLINPTKIFAEIKKIIKTY
jgi:heptosyltransferase-2